MKAKVALVRGAREAYGLAAALLDRLLHRCHIVNIRGNSYRMRRHAELSKAIHPTAARAVLAQRSGDGGSAS